MRISPWNLWLALVFALLMALAWTGGSGSEHSERDSRPLFPELRVERVATLRIEAAQPEVGGTSFVLLRRALDPEASAPQVLGPPAPGDSLAQEPDSLAVPDARLATRWVLPGAFDHPADTPRVERWLARLRSIDRIDRVADEAGSHALYGLTESATRVSCFDEAGSLLAEFLQGEPAEPRIAERELTYVRRTPESAVYRVPRLARASLRIEDWLDRQLLRFDASTVIGLELRGPELSGWSAQRLEWDRWSDASGAALPSALLRRLLYELEALAFESVLAALEPGLPGADTDGRSDALELTLSFEAREPIRLHIGPARADGLRPARTEGQAWLVGIAPRTYDLLLARLRSIR